MLKDNLIYYSLILFLLVATTGCMKVKDFTSDEIKWFLAYKKNDTAIFISKRGELDTMFFYKMIPQGDTVREGFGRGYYNENYLSVPYKLSEGSYHHFAFMGDGKTRYDQNIFSISKKSDGTTTFEITFLGTIFNGKELSNIKRLSKYVYYFDSAKATYVGMDMERGKAIKDFTFDIRSGITTFTDERSVKWEKE